MKKYKKKRRRNIHIFGRNKKIIKIRKGCWNSEERSKLV
jgi:cobalamin biosynthesis protein CbiD